MDELYVTLVARKMWLPPFNTRGAKVGNGKPGDGSAYKAPGKRFSYYHYSRGHNPSAHCLTAVDKVCYNFAIFEVKNRGLVMALSSRFEEALVFATQLHA